MTRSTPPSVRPDQATSAPWSGGLRGKVALVTGASRGVGKGVALTLGEAGADVYVTGRSVRRGRSTQGLPGTIQDTADEVTERGGKGIAIRCDHARDAEIRHLASSIRRRHGHLDILVNNAFGGEEGKQQIITYDGFPFWRHDFDEWWYRMFTAYLRASLATTYYILPLMLRRRGGLIVNTLWWNRNRYLADLFFDVASAGVGRMVYGLALELRPKKIAAVAVSPGWTRTERMTDVPAGVLHRQAQSPEYVGRAVVNLALDQRVLTKSGRILEVGQLAREYGFRDVDGRFWDYHENVARHPRPGWPRDEL
jgi:NAD(P)-dependent dehydrogenase (short-subunit alcohol dehydrogenase family)